MPYSPSVVLRKRCVREDSYFEAAFCGAIVGIVSRDFLQLPQAMMTLVALNRNAKENETYPGRIDRTTAGMKTIAIDSQATVLE